MWFIWDDDSRMQKGETGVRNIEMEAKPIRVHY